MQLIEVFATALTTTASVLLMSLSGAIIVRRMTDGGATALKGIVYVTALITLPCLLFTRLATRFDETLLFESWPILVFGACQISFGLFSAYLSGRLGLLSEEYVPLLTLALVSQNAVAFPYALMAAIRHVWWWDGGGGSNTDRAAIAAANAESLRYGETLLFMFNICTSLCLWSIGNQTIARAAIRRAGGDPNAHEGGGSSEADSFAGKAKRFYATVVRPALSLPVVASFAGLAVGLTPPLRYMILEMPVTSTIADGLYRAGDACVPLTMIVLGCSLAVQHRKRQLDAAAAVAAAAPQGNDDGAAGACPAPPAPPAAVVVAVTESPEAAADRRPSPGAAPVSSGTSSVPMPPPPPVAAKSTPTPTSTPKTLPRSCMLPIEQNPSFDLPPADDTADDEAARGASDEAPLAVASIAQWRADELAARAAAEGGTRVAQSGTGAEAAAPSGTTTSGGGIGRLLLRPREWPDQWRFVAIVMLVRFLLMPAGGLFMLWLSGMQPAARGDGGQGNGGGGFVVDQRRVMLMVMIVQSFSPSAVNGGVICTLHGYFPERHGLMLAAIYVGCAVPCVLWMSVGLAFLG